MPLVIGVSATPKRFNQLLESDHLSRTVHTVRIGLNVRAVPVTVL
jgi:hypothetical protein